MDDAQRRFKSFSASLEGVGSGLKEIAAPAVKGFQAVEGVGDKAADIVKKGLGGFAVASTAVAGFGTAAVKSGMAFDATMSKVSAISGKVSDEDLPEIIKKANEMGISFKDTGDATSTVMDILRNKALQMGATTKFSASEAGEAMTYMSMAGWKAGDMIGGIEGIMNLAAASGEDLALTSDIVTDALTAFGKSASDSGHLADIMAAASSNANTNVAMLGESFKYVAPVAGALGYSMEDTSLALGLMANSGIKASQAGTSLRTAMTNMASPTKNMAAVMDTYGISLTNADGSMMSLQEVMIQLREKMGGLDEATQASAASMLFGKEAMSGMLAIINAAPEDFEKLTGAIYDCNGAAEEMAATMIDNLQGDLTLLGSAFESLQIAISDALTPTLREFAQFGQKAMANLLEGFQGNGVSGFMNALSSIVTDGVAMLAQKAPEFVSVSGQFIAAFVEGILHSRSAIMNSANEILIMFGDGLRSWLSSNKESLNSFGNELIRVIFQGFLTAGDIISENIGQFIPLLINAFATYHEALFTVGIEILGAIGRGIVENQGEIQTIASDAIKSMVTALRENAPAIIEGGIALIEALAGAIMENMPLILETGAEIVGHLVSGITSSLPAFAVAILPIITHIGKIIDTVGKIKDVVKTVVDFVAGSSGIGKIIEIGKKLMAGIQALFALIMAHPVIAAITAIIAVILLLWTHCEEFREFFIGLWEGLKEAVSAFAEWISGKMGEIVQWIKEKWEGIPEFFSGIWEGIKAVFTGVTEFFGEIFASAVEAVQTAWSAAIEFFSGIWEGIQAVFSVVAEVLGGFFSAAWEAVQAAWDVAVEFFAGVWEGIQEVFSNVVEVLGGFFTDAWGAIKEVWEGAKEFFGALWADIKGKTEEAAKKISEFLKNAWEEIKKVWDSAKKFFGDLWADIKEKGSKAAEKVQTAFENGWDAIKKTWNGALGFFSGVWDDITGVFGNAWEAFKDIGGNILEGLWNGISDKIGWLKSKVTGIVDIIKSWFTGKSGFDEHSPSKWSKTVFYRVMQGGVNGLDDGESILMREVNSISDKVKNGLNFGTIAMGLSANYSGASRYGAPEASQRRDTGWGNTTVNIYSPKAVDGVQAAREWKKTSQQIALGLI